MTKNDIFILNELVNDLWDTYELANGLSNRKLRAEITKSIHDLIKEIDSVGRLEPNLPQN